MRHITIPIPDGLGPTRERELVGYVEQAVTPYGLYADVSVQDTPDPGGLPVAEIVGAAQVRQLAGGVTRHTLIRWRRENGFPAPVRVLPEAGPGGSDVELWDARAVRAWLAAR